MFVVAAAEPRDQWLAVADYLFDTRCQNKGHMEVFFRRRGAQLKVPSDAAGQPDLYIDPPRRRLSRDQEIGLAEAIAIIDSYTGQREIRFGILN